MTTPAIHVDSLSKRYRIGTPPAGLRGALGAMNAALGRRARQASNTDDLWALRNVSFRVTPGEVVGLIGRNGAGKSTLLKVLSRITEPTSGRAFIRGRVGSLLEVGTGFHPELTGRENVYLNGALLGMKRAEIRRRFDEIVAFAEIERFLDTPVKRYSSGMYVRLAFAVAAHLQPEILLVDEVLAVGDLSFQAKCLGRMGDVAQSGRTILFVSHNMGAIGRLCRRSILLDAGRVVADGPTEQVIRKYISSVYPAEACRTFAADATAPVCIRRVRLLDNEGRPATRIDRRRSFVIETEFEARRDVREVHVGVALDRQDGTPVCHTLSLDATGSPLELSEGERVTARVTYPGGLFSAGDYIIHVGLADPVRAFDHREACAFQLIDSGSFASTDPSGRPRPGIVTLRLPWVLERSSSAQSDAISAEMGRANRESVLQGVASCPCS